MKQKLYLTIGVWICTIFISLWWNINAARKNQNALTFQTARTVFEQMVVTRRWNASHNGVYVRVTEETKPNPFLKDSQRDLNCGGLLLTKINPAFMTRQISEMTSKNMAIQFHVAGLTPLNPANSPSEWERKTLESFSSLSLIEKGEYTKTDQGPVFLYMKGLKAEQSCLECHTNKKYKLNDIVGGISVTITNPEMAELMPIILGHLVIGFFGFLFISIIGQKLINAYQTIQHQAIYDALTQIPNRRYFNDRFKREVQRNRRSQNPLSLLMADIDNFKNYNDNYGHNKGDEVLSLVAKTIDTTLKRSVDFCARFGGEEFIIVLPDTDKTGAVFIAEQLLERISGLNIDHAYSDVKNTVSISVGIACKSDEITDHEALIKKADEALYKAKANGKNRYEVLS